MTKKKSANKSGKQAQAPTSRSKTTANRQDKPMEEVKDDAGALGHYDVSRSEAAVGREALKALRAMKVKRTLPQVVTTLLCTHTICLFRC